MTVADTRGRVIDAAIECFARHGVEESTLAMVANAAGIHRVTLHRLFPGGRDELLVAVLDRSAERLIGRVRRAVVKAPTAADAAVDGATVAVVEARRDPAVVRAVRSLEAQRVVLSVAGTPLRAIVTEMWDLIVERADDANSAVVTAGRDDLLVNHWVRVLMGLVANPVGVETPAKVRRYLRTFVVPALVGPRSDAATSNRSM